MRLALFALFTFAAYGSIAAFRYPAGYGFYPYAYNPSQLEEEAQARQLFMRIRNFLEVNIPRTTVRATFTSVVNMTCTVSVTRICRGLQLPFPRRTVVLPKISGSEIIEVEEDDDEQFPVAPTVVQPQETTSLPTREARAADPQYFLNPNAYANQLRDIQSAFYSSAYDRLPLSSRDPYALPVADQRQLFSGLLTATTVMSTMLKMNMVTQTPRCSRAGPIPQCANAS